MTSNEMIERVAEAIWRIDHPELLLTWKASAECFPGSTTFRKARTAIAASQQLIEAQMKELQTALEHISAESVRRLQRGSEYKEKLEAAEAKLATQLAQTDKAAKWLGIMIDCAEDSYDQHKDWPSHKDDPGFYLNRARKCFVELRALPLPPEITT